jgi:hypothetical protein
MKLTSFARRNSLEIFQDWGANVLNEDKFFEAIEKNSELVEALNEYKEGTGYGLDTADREWMMEVVTSDIIGMVWPLYGDTQDYKNQFVDKMKACEVFECVNW